MYVPGLAIDAIILNIIMAFVLPALTWHIMRKRKCCTVPEKLPFFLGCAVFFVFAILLEGLFNNLIILTEWGKAIKNDTIKFAVFAGLTAGLFEETGRFCAFKALRKSGHTADSTALLYGAGHGSFEAFFILITTMVMNFFFALYINANNTEVFTQNLDGEKLAQMEQIFDKLRTTPWYVYLIAIWERVVAITVHIANSVLVWFSTRKVRHLYLFLLAILIHALIDSFVVYAQGFGMKEVQIELLLTVFASAVAVISFSIWKKLHRKEE
jgi:uncharacterized membrane protein YhfC